MGLSGHDYLSMNGSIYKQSKVLSDNLLQLITCDRDKCSMKVEQTTTDSSKPQEIDLTSFLEFYTLDDYNTGRRWEGSVLADQPFGFGKRFDEDNYLLYEGFILDGKKVCFGSIYYPQSACIEYCGTFYEDKKHGFGQLRDKTGALVYEGEWMDDKPIELNDLTISGPFTGDIIRMNIKELLVSNGCECNVNQFILSDYAYLVKITIGFSVLKDLTAFCISRCHNLTSIRIAYDNCNTKNTKELIMPTCCFSITDCNSLESISFENNCFRCKGSIEFASLFFFIVSNHVDLPKLTSITIQNLSFSNQTQLSLKSMFIVTSLFLC